MTAMEKVAWTELVICVVTMVVVSAMVPWLGHGAAGGFGLLGLIVGGSLFLRSRGKGVVVDERDRAIEMQSLRTGVVTAWMTLFVALIAATMWSAHIQAPGVSTQFLNWLIWVQFVICYAVKGLVAVVLYRRQNAA